MRNLILIYVTLVLICCQNEPTTPPVKKVESEKATMAGSTAEMAKELASIYRSLSSQNNSYVNLRIAEEMRQKEEQAYAEKNLPDYLNFKLQKAYQLVYGGKTREGIQEAKQIQEVIKNNQLKVLKEYQLSVDRLLAIGYVRLGEQENCIMHHNEQSCIFPIEGIGKHSMKEGSKEGLKYLSKILDEYPNDLISRWLLNVAHMTLGTYPNSVPARFRLPEKSLRSDIPFKVFKDIAPKKKLDVNALSGGVVVEDFDRDSDYDLMASSWSLKDQVKYFENDGHGNYNDKTIEAGISGITGGLNMLHGDYNNDGFEDVIILRGAWLGMGNHPNSLLKNNGDGTFIDVTKEVGFYSKHPTQTASFVDYNNDGWLDIFVGNESFGQFRNPCELFENQGDGTFKEVASAIGLSVISGIKGSTWGDIDNDGDMDVYLSNVLGDNFLFKNEGATGQYMFTNVTTRAGVAEPAQSFPCWMFDYNNDGWLDIFVSGFSMDRYNYIVEDVIAEYLNQPFKCDAPRLYRNKGDGTFEDVTKKSKLFKPMFTMGCNYGDLDNDGYLDFYLGTGEPDMQAIVPNRMFRNNKGKNFQDVTTAGRFGHLQKGHGIAFNDLDFDGDQDIYAVMGGAYEGDVFQNVLFENPGFGNNWIKIYIKGTTCNASAIGTRVKIETENPQQTIYTTVVSGGSFGSASYRREIGLGKSNKIHRVEVDWPCNGEKQIFENVAVNQQIQIVQGQDQYTRTKLTPVEL